MATVHGTSLGAKLQFVLGTPSSKRNRVIRNSAMVGGGSRERRNPRVFACAVVIVMGRRNGTREKLTFGLVRQVRLLIFSASPCFDLELSLGKTRGKHCVRDLGLHCNIFMCRDSSQVP